MGTMPLARISPDILHAAALAADSCPAAKPPIGPVFPIGMKALTVVPGTNLDHILSGLVWASNTRVQGNPR